MCFCKPTILQVLHRVVFLQFLPSPNNYVSNQRNDLTVKGRCLVTVIAPLPGASSLWMVGTRGQEGGKLQTWAPIMWGRGVGTDWHCLGTPSEPRLLSCVPRPTPTRCYWAPRCWPTPMAQLPPATLRTPFQGSSWTYSRGTWQRKAFHPGISHSPKASNLDLKNFIFKDMLIGLKEGNDHRL